MTKPERPKLEFPKDVKGLVPNEAFIHAAQAYGLEFLPGEVERYGHFLALLLAANELVNLTSIKDENEAWSRHIFDALTLLPVLSEAKSSGREPLTVADVGSGGGVPGIPLAIAMPQANITLIEATGKKHVFLDHAAKELGLTNTHVLHARAEAVAQDRSNWREKFDVVVCRAVGKVSIVAELATGLVRPGGLVAMIKGEKAEEELQKAKDALDVLHLYQSGVVHTPTGRIVVLEKVGKSPSRFPRSASAMKRTPLVSEV